MSSTDLTDLLTTLDLTTIEDPTLRVLVTRLLNLLDTQLQANRELRVELQQARDEIARLKGEQARPRIPGSTPPSPPPALSSEAERQTPRPHTKRAKRDTLRIDRQETLRCDPATLPADAEFKGYDPLLVQDVVFRSDNVCFEREVWYAPSTGQRYCAPLPPGYDGSFGPGLQALVLTLYYGGLMSQPKIHDLLAQVGVDLATGTLATFLIHDQDAFHAEKDAIYEAGLRSSPWQHLDATGTRVDGQNQHCHIVANPLYTIYHTAPGKDRLSVLDALRNGRPRTFLLNAEAEGYLDNFGLAAVQRRRLAALPRDQVLDAATLDALLAVHLAGVGPQQSRWIRDALAIAAYHAETEWPVVQLLMVDDAPQFGLVTAELALCWIHEGRHYKKLMPVVPGPQRALAGLLTEFWTYYRELQVYRAAPSATERARLEAEFDRVFGQATGYGALDERLAKTRSKKGALLLGLAHPEVPSHNNEAELGARGRVRKRDVSFGPQTEAGRRAWDTFGSLAATAKKLGVSFMAYLEDRVWGRNALPALAELIGERATEQDLGASWPAP